MELYLDHNATTPIHPLVAHAIDECFQAQYANPASPHAAGRRAKALLDDSRRRIAQILGAQLDGPQADRLIFTSGGTESNNLAIFGISQLQDDLHTSRVIISAIEHPSVQSAAEKLLPTGMEIVRLPVSQDGEVLVESLEHQITDKTVLVSIMMGNNETGVLQPIKRLAAICQSSTVKIHTDAVQVAGKIPLNFHNLGADAMSISAHKFRGPPGIGALLLRYDTQLEPILFGGHQQMGLRPGTEPLPQVVGMCKALEIWDQSAPSMVADVCGARNRFEEVIQTELPEVVINGWAASRLPHTSNISFLGIDRQGLLMALDLDGIACSTGSACASGSSEPSHVLLAMGCSQEVVNSALRFSFGMNATIPDGELAARRISNVVRQLRARRGTTISPGGPRGRQEKSL